MFGPIPILRLEGLILLVAGLVGFSTTGLSWWLFAVLLLVPDISMVGYLRNPSRGASIYNVGHSLLGPALLVAWHWLGGPVWALGLGCIWLAHVGMDRLLGYGLKFGDDFAHTHLGWIGGRGD